MLKTPNQKYEKGSEHKAEGKDYENPNPGRDVGAVELQSRCRESSRIPVFWSHHLCPYGLSGDAAAFGLPLLITSDPRLESCY